LTKEETKGGIRGALQRVSKEVFLHILHEQMQERVDRLKALRSSLVTNISHQLRTPLSVIKAALQLLSEERVGRVGPDAERLLQIANKNIEKIVEFIERLSQFAQIEYEGLDMNKRWTDVSKVVEQAYRRVKEEAEKKQVELSVKVGKELFAMADPERLEEAIFQGMANAVKFTLSGGKIKVVAKKAGKQVKVEISDTGIGLAPEDVEKVFSEFFRTDDAALYHPRGSGLGLAIARSIIKAHGGQVLMRSKPGKGCCLTFLLPKE
jgi:signal transduction histidine kinase